MENSSKTSFGIGRIIALIGCVLLIIGAFLPWSAVFGIEVIGTQGDGVITMGIGILAIILLLIRKVPLWISLILGLISLAIGVIDLNELLNTGTDVINQGLMEADSSMAELLKVNIGSGMYATLAGGVLLLVGPIVGYIKK